jgi:predicted nucleotidyltransferase
VEFKESIGFEFIELAEISENVLGVKVDLLSKRTVNPEMRFLEEAGRKIAI